MRSSVFFASCALLLALPLAAAARSPCGKVYFAQPKLYCDTPEELSAALVREKDADADGLFPPGCSTFTASTYVCVPPQEGTPLTNTNAILLYRIVFRVEGKTRTAYIAFPADAMDDDGQE